MERRSVTESQEGKKANDERKVGECFQWKAHGQCSKGDQCSFSHDKKTLAPVAKVRDEKDDRLLPHQVRRQRLSIKEATRMKALTREVRFHADTKVEKIRRVNLASSRVSKLQSLKKDAYMATNTVFDMLRQKKTPARSQRKVVPRISRLVKEVKTIGLCMSRLLSEKSILCEPGKIGPNHTVNSPRARGTT